MARNFIIQYSGREGSSAIISALSAQKGVHVPLFEELDAYRFLKTHKRSEYPKMLDEIFTSRSNITEQKKSVYMHRLAETEEIKTTGFKWRIEGYIPDIAKVLARHNVTVFSLQRRNFLNYVCSLYVHRYGNKLQSDIEVPLHPHFQKKFESTNGSDEEQRKQLNKQEFALNKRLFLATAKLAVNLRKKLDVKTQHLALLGVPIGMMFYEDFDLNPKAFISHTLKEIGLDTGNEFNPFCGFEKVHKSPLSDRITGLEKATNTRRYRRYQKEYQSMIAATKAVSHSDMGH